MRDPKRVASRESGQVFYLALIILTIAPLILVGWREAVDRSERDAWRAVAHTKALNAALSGLEEARAKKARGRLWAGQTLVRNLVDGPDVEVRYELRRSRSRFGKGYATRFTSRGVYRDHRGQHVVTARALVGSRGQWNVLGFDLRPSTAKPGYVPRTMKQTNMERSNLSASEEQQSTTERETSATPRESAPWNVGLLFMLALLGIAAVTGLRELRVSQPYL